MKPRPYISVTGITRYEDLPIIVEGSNQLKDCRTHDMYVGFLVGPKSFKDQTHEPSRFVSLRRKEDVKQASRLVGEFRALGFKCIAHLCKIRSADWNWNLGILEDLPFDGVQINAAFLEEAEDVLSRRSYPRCHYPIVIHQMNAPLLQAHDREYLCGFWRGLSRGEYPPHVLYDMSRGEGVCVSEDNLREFVRWHVDFANNQMSLGLAGGLCPRNLKDVCKSLQHYGFGMQSLSIDAESGVLDFHSRLDKEKVKGYYSEAAAHVASV